jgi:hypothetical protein
MAEYGNFFDYQLSAMGLEYLTIGLMAAYAIAVFWIAAHSKNSVFGISQTV